MSNTEDSCIPRRVYRYIHAPEIFVYGHVYIHTRVSPCVCTCARVHATYQVVNRRRNDPKQRVEDRLIQWGLNLQLGKVLGDDIPEQWWREEGRH